MTDTKDEKKSLREILKLKNAELWEVTKDQCSLKDTGELELLYDKPSMSFFIRLQNNFWYHNSDLQVIIATNFSPDWKIFAFSAPDDGIYFLKIAGLDFKSDSHPEILNFETVLRGDFTSRVKESGDLIPWFSQFLKQEPSSVIPLSKNSYHDAYPDLPNYREIRDYNEIFYPDDQTYIMVDVSESDIDKAYEEGYKLTENQGSGLWAQFWGGNQDSSDLEKFFSTLSISQKVDQTPSDLGQKVQGQQNLGQGFQPGLQPGGLGQGFQPGLQQGNLGQGIDKNYSLFFEVVRIKNAELWEATLDHYTFKYKGDIVLLYSKKLDLILLRIHDHTFAVDKSLQVITLRNDELGFVYLAICSPGGFDLIKVPGKVPEGYGSIEPPVTSNLLNVIWEKTTIKECNQYKDKFASFQEVKSTNVIESPAPQGYDRHTDNYSGWSCVEYVLGVDRQSFPVIPISQSELDNAKNKTSNLSKYYEGSGIWQHLWNDDIDSEYLENYFANLHSHKELEQLPKGQQGKGQQNVGQGSEQQGEDQGWHTVESHGHGGDTRTVGSAPQKGGDLKEISAP